MTRVIFSYLILHRTVLIQNLVVGVVYDVNYQLTYLQLYGIQQTLQVIILPLASQIHQMHHRTHQIHCHFHWLDLGLCPSPLLPLPPSGLGPMLIVLLER